MSRTKKLIFEIEIAKQRLHHAIVNQNNTLAFETQVQLANLNAMLLEATKATTIPEPSETYYLVFCESFQDGRVCSKTEYRLLMRRMNECDLGTHVAIEIDGPIDQVEQAIALESTERRSVKKTA